MNAVYLLWHVRDGDEDNALLIGVYRTESAANEAIARLRHKPGFAESPEAFKTEKYELDKDHWTEGYILD